MSRYFEDLMASREFIIGLIELYRKNQCLWKTTCPEYTKKDIKNRCYEEIVIFAKKYYKEADKAFVQQKIQNLRTTFRKEMKKLNNSKRNGKVPPKTKLKTEYIDENEFRDEDDDNNKSEESNEDEISDLEALNNTQNVESVNGDVEEEEGQNDSSMSLPERFQVSKIFKECKQITAPKRTLKRKKDDLYATCSETIDNTTQNCDTKPYIDEFDALAITWAAKLRKLDDDDQRVLADDLINQVLKKAYFNELTRNTELQERY